MPAALPPDTRDRLLDEADRLLAERGYARMTVADLAREAGIGKGSVYLLFPSKEEVALSCVDRMAERVLAELRRLAEGPGTSPDRLKAMLRARVLMRFDYAAGHRRSLTDLLAACREELLRRRAGHFRREVAALAEVLAQGTASGELADAPRSAADALVLATNALLPLSLSPAELGRRAEVARRVDDLADLLVRGLLPAGRSAHVSHELPTSPSR